MSSEYMWFCLALGRVAAQSGPLTATSRVSDTWKPAHKSLPQELKEQECGVVVVTGCSLLMDLIEPPESFSAGD